MFRNFYFIFLFFLYFGIVGNVFSQTDSTYTNVPDNKKDTLEPIVDTLDTDDKYKKIVLFDDFTWDFMVCEKPYIDEEMFDDAWTQDNVHAYRDVSIASFPDKIEIFLTDSLHGYKAPYVGSIRSGFGYRRRRAHKGVDIPLKVGDSIFAAFPGKVRVAKTTRYTGGYGNLVVIRHTNGLETYYAHLSKLLVKEDELVNEGELIGLGGSTGRSSGPHLHFETRYKGKAFDPRRIFDFNTGEIVDSVLVLRKHHFNPKSRYQGKKSSHDIVAKTSSDQRYHTISRGDTLIGIASKYSTSVQDICRLNGISSNKVLKVGAKLRIQ